MKILVIGGTVFLGRHIVASALTLGHEITLFNRGLHNPKLFPQVEKIVGDRDGDLAALEGRSWDAVIDPSGYVPRIVKISAEKLADKTAHYTFISTISVYSDFSSPEITEETGLGKLEDETIEEITNDSYGPLKVLCEQVVEKTLPGRNLIIRPGLIVGPHDPTDRFTYWPERVAQGGEVLAPGRPERLTQFIDVRDLADWTIKLVEQKHTGIFNATGPDYGLTLGQLLAECDAVGGNNASFSWLGEQFLIEAGVAPWSELPLWLPESEPLAVALTNTSVKKAIEAGLTFRPLTETVYDTLDWVKTLPADRTHRAGMKAEREAEILQKWHSR